MSLILNDTDVAVDDLRLPHDPYIEKCIVTLKSKDVRSLPDLEINIQQVQASAVRCSMWPQNDVVQRSP